MNSQEQIADLAGKYIATDPLAIYQAYSAIRDMGERGEISALLLDGPPGTGKTMLAKIITGFLNARRLRFQFFEGSGRKDLLFDAAFATEENPLGEGILPQALRLNQEPGLLVVHLDEIDKANADVDGFFLNFLQEGLLSIPQFGDIKADPSRILFILTKNDQRDLTAALLRRCRVAYMQWPSLEAETDILRGHYPWLPVEACTTLLEIPRKLRQNPEVKKAPSTPELIRVVYDLADYIRLQTDPDPEQVGIIFRGAIAQLPQDHRFVEKSVTFWGQKLIEVFANLDIPPREGPQATVAKDFLNMVGVV